MTVREFFANVNLQWCGDFIATIRNLSTRVQSEYTVKQLMENDELYNEWKDLKIGCWAVTDKCFVITAFKI